MFKHISVHDLLEYKKLDKKWLMLTSYDVQQWAGNNRPWKKVD